MAASVTCLVVTGAEAAPQDGGISIGDAPDVILGEAEFGAPLNGARFWRIPLLRGDLLTMDLSNAGKSSLDRAARFCLLAPNVNDSRLQRSECVLVRTLKRGQKQRLQFVARSAGRWTLGAVSGTCATFQSCATGSTTQPFIYEFTAYVRHFTRTRLDGPRTARARARIGFTGTVSGVDGGTVELQLALGGGWKSAATVAIKANGSFAWSIRAAARPGSYRVRATYPGDDSHLPSGAIHSYRVVGG